MVLKRVTALILLSLAAAMIDSSSLSIRANSVENVRIGLYYAGTACSVISVSAEKGLDICKANLDNTSVLLSSITGQLKIRKDAWYYKNNGILKEYKAGSQVYGEKYGPYHLKLASNFRDSSDALKQVQAFREMGVPAYLAYTGKWEVWTGYYTSSVEAAADIEKYRPLVGNSEITIIGPPADRYSPNISIEREDGTTLFLYADGTGLLQLWPSEQNSPRIFNINGRNYRGALELKRQEGSDLTVINYVDIESYLYGVVPGEMESYSPMEALKSQALVARNYTYCNIGKFAKWGFDLDTTVQSQVYKGYDGETANTNRAVDETRGLVLKDGDNFAQCFYFSSSGGRTEDVKNVWGSDIPYLKSVEDPYESGKSARYRWEKTITAENVKDIMKRRGYDIGDITGIDVIKRSDAGRVIEMKITGTKGAVTFYRESCRTIFGLDSQWFYISTDTDAFIASENKTTAARLLGKKAVNSDGSVVEIKVNNGKIAAVGADGKVIGISTSRPTKYTFSGKGYGHAVGLSQEGAKGFASIGKKFHEIVEHYFPGTKVGVVG